MALANALDKVIGFLRGGYPTHVTSVGYIPLLALLPRRLSDEDAAQAIADLTCRGFGPVDEIDIRVAVTRLTGELASDADTGRIKQLLVARGFPVSTRSPLKP
jgi:hypothetical protein